MEENKETKKAVELPAKSKKWIFWLIGAVLAGLIALVALLPQPYYTEGFKTLSELQEYAKTIDEFVAMDGRNIFFPNYESYYQGKFGASFLSTLGNRINWILCSCKLKQKPVFSASFFKTILLHVTNERKQRHWVGDYVQKINLGLNSKLVVFGVIQGAFHSLVRDLEELKKIGILNDNLKIINPDYYLVFLGNVINRSPYTLETLSVVLRLLKENPENIIYLRGTNEFFDYWKLHTLRRELELRLKMFSSFPIPLEREVCDFFDTLPMTLYCTIPPERENSLDYFKVSPFIKDEKIISELAKFSCYEFLIRPSTQRIGSMILSDSAMNSERAEGQKKLVLKASIQDIKKRQDYETTDGLRLLDSVDGVSAWTVLSSPTEVYRIGWNFFPKSMIPLVR